MTVFVILPIFLIVFAGWLMKKARVADDAWFDVLNRFAYYVALPAVIVSSLWGINFLSREILDAALLSLLTILLFSLAVFLALSLFKIGNNLKSALFITATAGNTIYMGFPLVKLGYGEAYFATGALVGAIYLIIPLLLSIFIIRFWSSKEHHLLTEIAYFLKNPLVISFAIGVILSFLRLEGPLALAFKEAILMLGATASPAALFALGGFMQGRFLKENIKLTAFAVFLKMIGFLVFLKIVNYFWQIEDFKVFALLGSMPVAVTAFIIAERFKLQSDLVANAILVSTILSFILVPIVMMIFP